jgi:sarcosine oxidase gamma subunit
MAIPLGEETKFKNSIKNIFGLKMPSPNKSVKSKDTRIFSTQPDQIFVLTKRTDDPEKSMAIEFDGSAYITDQTDAWVILEISGIIITRSIRAHLSVGFRQRNFPIG